MLNAINFNIQTLERKQQAAIQKVIDQKTKPPGALGKLESLAMQLALISATEKIVINKPTMLVFAGDHGIAEAGVSIAPSAVTQQMVINFLNGGAAINCFCRINEMAIKVIDAGILLPVDDQRLIDQSLGLGTRNFSQQPAMSAEQVIAGITAGAEIAEQQMKAGSNLLGFGEMGIGNTSSASALMAAILQLPVTDCVGRGTGIDDDALQIKIKLIEQALELHKGKLDCPIDLLASVGGFEIVQMVGAMLAAAEHKLILLIDGFIATAAALVAKKINPDVLDYMVFCHQSNEQGHRIMLNELNASPLLSLDMRLGEGTGAALALPLIHAAASFYNDMASFESAGVNAV